MTNAANRPSGLERVAVRKARAAQLQAQVDAIVAEMECLQTEHDLDEEAHAAALAEDEAKYEKAHDDAVAAWDSADTDEGEPDDYDYQPSAALEAWGEALEAEDTYEVVV